MRFHQTKWPEVCSNKRIQPFFQRWTSLSEFDECLLFAECMIVPPSLQDRVIKQFHNGHQGISCMKALVRTYVYWPNMDKQLKELAHKCSNCQLAAKSLRKTTLSSWPISESPWSCLHIWLDLPKDSVIFYSWMLTANDQRFFKWNRFPVTLESHRYFW